MVFIKKNLISLIIILLILIVILQRFSSCGGQNKQPIVESDTVTHIYYNYIKDSGQSKPIFIKGERDTVLEKSVEYVPSEDYGELVEQFEKLKQELLSKSIYKDSIQIDTFGTVTIKDTIQQNKIIGRSFINNLKIPIKETIITNTVTQKPKNQFYIGGSLSGNKDNYIHAIDLGILFKNKKDQIIGVKGGLDVTGNWNVGVQSYWKIKLRK